MIENFEDLEKRWYALCGFYTKQESLIINSFQAFYRSYQAPGRFYHNFHHLRALFLEKDLKEDLLIAPNEVEFAIWYHDLVYEVTQKDNETQSAQRAKMQLSSLGLKPEPIDRIVTWIEATQKHKVEHSKSSSDLFYFLDFDLSILGGEWPAYLQYINQIRSEYQIYPDAVYRPGRIAVLQSLLDRDWIYHTQVYRNTKEKQARQNIRREIHLLHSLG